MSAIINAIKGLVRGEPVLTGELVRLLLAASGLFGLGWTEDGISKGIGAIVMVVSMVLTLLARRASTPVANPQVQITSVLAESRDANNQVMATDVIEVPKTKPVLTLSGWRN